MWRATSGPGLPLAAAVALALVAGFIGGTLDVLTGAGLRVFFSLCFVAGCLLAVLLVRPSALLPTVLTPPLVYLTVTLFAAAAETTAPAGSWLNQQLLEAVTSLVIHAPTLLVATVSAIVVAVVRARKAPSRARPIPANGAAVRRY